MNTKKISTFKFKIALIFLGAFILLISLLFLVARKVQAVEVKNQVELEQFLFIKPLTTAGLESNISYDYFYHFTHLEKKTAKK
jgi:hypothetical protein